MSKAPYFILVLLVGLCVAALKAWTIYTVWEWHFVPYGAPAFQGVWQVYALVIIIALIRMKDNDGGGDYNAFREMFIITFGSIFTLAIAWCLFIFT